MKIVITDGATLNPGDLDWSPLEQFGDVIYYDATPKELAPERCADADIIITNKTLVQHDTINAAQHLKLIAVSATGYNNVDVAAAKAAVITVCNVPEYGTFSVAQHAFALLLELVNHVGTNVASTKADEWARSGQWTYTKHPVTELKDKTLGVVGYGRIGRQVGVLGKAFGMRLIFHNRSAVKQADGRQVEMETIFRESDVVSLHCPLTPENKGFVNLRVLSTMKSNAVLINTSRGPLINESELVHALDNEMLSAAALDVLSEEPPAMGHPLIHHPRCIVTPHNAWLSFEARQRLMKVTVENISRFLSQQPQHVVNP